MDCILIIIIIVIVIVIFAFVFKRMKGGFYTMYKPGRTHTSADPRQMIDALTTHWLRKRTRKLVTDTAFNVIYSNYPSAYRQMLLAANVEHDRVMKDIPAELWSYQGNDRGDLSVYAFDGAFAEAFVSFYFERKCVLKNLTCDVKNRGSSNIVLKGQYYKSVSPDKLCPCVLRIYKRGNIVSYDGYNEYEYMRTSNKEIYGYLDDQYVAKPIYGSTDIPILSAQERQARAHSTHRPANVYWLILPVLTDVKDNFVIHKSQNEEKYLVFPSALAKSYITSLMNTLQACHDHGYVYCDWKWDNFMVRPNSQNVVLSDIDFTPVNAKTINDRTVSISRTHADDKLSDHIFAKLRRDYNAHNVNTDEYITLFRNYDNYIALKDCFATVFVAFDRTSPNQTPQDLSRNYRTYLIGNVQDINHHINSFNRATVNKRFNKTINLWATYLIEVIRKGVNTTPADHLNMIRYCTDEVTQFILQSLVKFIETEDINIPTFRSQLQAKIPANKRIILPIQTNQRTIPSQSNRRLILPSQANQRTTPNQANRIQVLGVRDLVDENNENDNDENVNKPTTARVIRNPYAQRIRQMLDENNDEVIDVNENKPEEAKVVRKPVVGQIFVANDQNDKNNENNENGIVKDNEQARKLKKEVKFNSAYCQSRFSATMDAIISHTDLLMRTQNRM